MLAFICCAFFDRASHRVLGLCVIRDAFLDKCCLLARILLNGFATFMQRFIILVQLQRGCPGADFDYDLSMGPRGQEGV